MAGAISAIAPRPMRGAEPLAAPLAASWQSAFCTWGF
jgi:hypothetical protein